MLEPVSPDVTYKPRLNLLVAYPYVIDSTIENVRLMGDECRWLIDSGAFTAYKIGRVITLDEYCSFIEKLPVQPWRYFTLDVIGDPVATMENYRKMRARGFDPIPIFTRGGDLSELDELYTMTDYVGLGGVAGADESAYQWLRAVMAHVGSRKVHILGFAAMNWLKHFQPYSCDASSWESGARYGDLIAYKGEGKFASYKRADPRGPPSLDIQRALRRLGVDSFALQREESWRGGNSVVRWACAATWIAASIDIERVLGVKLFLASASARVDILRYAFQSVMGRGDIETYRLPMWQKTRRLK